MFKLTTTALFAMLALGTTGYAADAAPELTIKKVTGSGSACQTDSRGRPTDWSVMTNNTQKSIVMDFDNFVADIDSPTKTCKIRITVDAPEGYTAYAFGTQVIGTTDMDDGKSGSITTVLKVPGASSKRKTYRIPAGSQDDVETPVERIRGRLETPCGGKNFKIGFNVQVKVKGDSVAKVSAVHGKFTNIRYKMRKCK